MRIRAPLPTSIKKTVAWQRMRSAILGHDGVYNDEYYAREVEGPASQAAPYIAKSLAERLAPRSVVDVGCGTGAMLEALQKHGVRCVGLEYASSGIKRCEARGLDVRRFDIENDTFSDPGRFDVAISFEVAEHLPARCSDRYVSLLCSLAPVVVMSAAPPGQGGLDHVNEQPPSWWIGKFAGRGYGHDASVSVEMTSEWTRNGVVEWYCNNTMVFRANAAK